MVDYQLVSDEMLLSAFQKAVELELEADFIKLLKQELLRRGTIENHDSIGGDARDPRG